MSNKKRLLFIEDLYDFYSNKYKRSTHFNYEKSGEPLVVQVHGKIEFEETDKDKDGLKRVHLQSCHTDLNRNGSNIDYAVMEAALPSFRNRPILSFIHKVVTDENPDGQWEFYSHNMHEDENGEVVYDEYPVGIIPESCNAQLVYDEEKKKTYCEVDGYIFEEYSKAAEILEREKECCVSVEISIRELSYDAKQKFLNIEDFWFSGVTILGKTPEGETVNPGMAGSNIKLADFKASNNSMFDDKESTMNELLERLDKLESVYNDMKNYTKGGTDLKKEFEEESTEVEEVGGTSSEENTEEETTTENNEEETSEESNAEEETSTEEESEESTDEEPEEESTSEEEGSESTEETFEQSNDLTRSFSISHEDIRCALYNLLAPFESEDNEWYYISSVFDTYFVYESWDSGKIFGQKYVTEDDNVSFNGERYSLRKEYLTESEYIELQAMRENYAELKSFKETIEKNELHEKREEIINSETFSVLSQKDSEGKYINKDFEKLVEEMDNYSLTDLETKIKVMHSDYISEHSNFAETKEESKPTSVKLFGNINSKPKKKRYGNLFQNEN